MSREGNCLPEQKLGWLLNLVKEEEGMYVTKLKQSWLFYLVQ
jgi:hypothetical protein